MRPRSLAHRRWGGLHPRWRQAIRIRGHRWTSHVGHWWREVVRSSRASRPSMHAMKVPVLSRTGAHPGRPVLWHIKIRSSQEASLWKQKCWMLTPQLTGGGWLLLGPEARGAPVWVLECPPPEVGTGASPSSAMRDRYSLSMRALSWADWGGSPPVALCAANVLEKANSKLFS